MLAGKLVGLTGDLLWLLLFIPGFFLQTLVHEGAHAAVISLFDGELVTFKPWPHRHNGRFYFGRVSWRIVTPLSVNARTAVYFAPSVAGALIVGMFGSLGHPAAYVLTTCATVDVVRNLLYRFIGRAPHHDVNNVDLPDSFIAVFALGMTFMWVCSSIITWTWVTS